MTETPVSGSYIATEEEARAYFAGDPRATAFLALSSLAWYLQRATKTIDNLPLRGRTYYDFVTVSPITGLQQDRQFPRWIDGMCYGWNVNSLLPEVPQEVLDACCEEALAIYLHNADTEGQARETLQNQGVKSYTLGGGYSETFGSSGKAKHKGLLSSEAFDLLKGYISGAIEATWS
ncbi:MAG: hypothetical protein WC343_05090 [Bacilli bacterium]|jgi:hypothetical protein